MAEAQVTDRGHGGKPEANKAGPSEAKRRAPMIVELYRSALGKKYAMALSGIVLLGFVLGHMVGNLHLYEGAAEMNHYGEFLRELGQPAVPREAILWITRVVLLSATVIHVHAAYALTVMNKKARPDGYQSKRDYIAADFAARTMRLTGVVVLLFILFHLADLTIGAEPAATGEFVHGAPYQNLVNSFERWPVAVFYLLANVALGVHIYHGAWSLFQSLGINNRRFNHLRRSFAIGFATIVTVGNLTFPLAVMTGLVEQEPLEGTVEHDAGDDESHSALSALR